MENGTKAFEMNKFERWNNLRTWGFNTPDFIVYDSQGIPKEWKKKTLAIRTFSNSSRDMLLPFHYDLNYHAAEIFAKDCFMKGYGVLVYPYVDRELSLVSGHCVRRDNASGEIEFMRGPAVGRDVHNSRLEHIEFAWIDDCTVEHEFHEVMDATSDILVLSGLHAVLVEFTVLKEPAGVLNEDLIFWEYREC